MTEPALIHRTTDNREFDDLDAARAHQRLVTRIEKFLDHRCAERSMPSLRQMLIDWTDALAAVDGGKREG